MRFLKRQRKAVLKKRLAEQDKDLEDLSQMWSFLSSARRSTKHDIINHCVKICHKYEQLPLAKEKYRNEIKKLEKAFYYFERKLMQWQLYRTRFVDPDQ